MLAGEHNVIPLVHSGVTRDIGARKSDSTSDVVRKGYLDALPAIHKAYPHVVNVRGQWWETCCPVCKDNTGRRVLSLLDCRVSWGI